MTARQAPCFIVASLLTALLVGAPGCYDDECDPACREGYSCYYGICLSRGFCPVDDPNAEAEQHCVEYDPDGTCTEYRGLCREGYSCECTFISGDGSCRRRECVLAAEVED